MISKEFTSHNNVSLCGRIMSIVRAKKDEVKITLGVARSAKPVLGDEGKVYHPLMRDKDNYVIREYITVRFFDKLADEIEKKQEVGDYIIVNAVVQNVRNHYSGTSKVDIWGISVAPKRRGNRTVNDHNRVDLRGKIVKSTIVNENLVIINLLTKCDKETKTPNDNVISTTYKSVTPVGFYYKDGNARLKANDFTKGTWLNIRGYIKTKEKNNKSIDSKFSKIRETYIYGSESTVIGITQPAEDELYQEYLKVKER